MLHEADGTISKQPRTGGLPGKQNVVQKLLQVEECDIWVVTPCG